MVQIYVNVAEVAPLYSIQNSKLGISAVTMPPPNHPIPHANYL